MGPFDMIAFVVLVVMIASVVKAIVNRHKPVTGAPSPEQDARLARLEERVKALEGAVGDSSFELKQKFRELEQ